MPDKSVHCVVTDMTYGVGIDFGGYRDGTKNIKRLIERALPEMRRVARLIAITPVVRNMYLYPKPTWTLGWFFGGGARGRWGFNHWQPVLVYGPDPRNRLKMMHTDVIRSHSPAARRPHRPSPPEAAVPCP